jgi:hypothetical protein
MSIEERQDEGASPQVLLQRIEAARASLAESSAAIYGKYLCARAAADAGALDPETRNLMYGALSEFQAAMSELEGAAVAVIGSLLNVQVTGQGCHSRNAPEPLGRAGASDLQG